MPKRVLVTGSSGRIGRDTVRAFQAAGWHVTGLDHVAPPSDADRPHDFVIGDVDRPHVVMEAVQGVDCVIHLAAVADDDPLPETIGTTLPDDDNFLTQLVPTNIVGPVTVLKAAVRAGVRRVILASSGQVIDGRLPDSSARVDEATPLAPRYLYACTKVYLESLGRVFSKKFGLEVLAARLGWCPRPGQEAAIRAYALAPYVYLSGPDAGRFFVATAQASDWPQTVDPKGGAFPFGVAYVTSRPRDENEVYDLNAARKLGYEPADAWAAWLTENGR